MWHNICAGTAAALAAPATARSMRALDVLLLQLPVPNNPATNVPLAAGYLKAYAHAQGLLERINIDILPRSLADRAGDALLVDAIVARRPRVLGLSLYTWNSERSLEIARRAKAQLPGLIVVGGGPEVQPDNEWVLRHPALDIGVIGEGEQTFAELLQVLERAECALPLRELQSVAGLAFRDAQGRLVLTPQRAPLPDLAVVPSPYLLGYLEAEPGEMLMVEVSRWCPYSCSFCLYGRNMGPKLGGRYFGLERLLAEIRWGLERGLTRVHFIEANLNLVPVFRPLMRALAELNADRRLSLYAELRGEHLTDEAAEALARAGLRVAEVGLQTANPAALRASQRRTDLAKWAAGTRRLYERGVEVLLDVILGLPEDDAAGVKATLEFIRREQLGPYDVFTLQVLPGVAVRHQAGEYGITYQDRPPYYVLGTGRMPYAELRRLRRELKQGAGLDPDGVDGCPEPRPDALAALGTPAPARPPIARVRLDADPLRAEEAACLAAHVDVVGTWPAVAGHGTRWLARAIESNPTTLFDLYLLGDPPAPDELRAWRQSLPFQPGYLDRVAVYRRAAPEPPYDRVSPRIFVVLPWSAQVEPDEYQGAAEVIWAYTLDDGEEPPLGAWRAAGGAGVWVRGAGADQVASWRAESGLRLWHS